MSQEITAKIMLKNTLVELQGSPQAVSAAIKEIEASSPTPPQGRRSLKPALKALFDDGFFSSPRTLAEIKQVLFEKQAVYSPTSLFPVMYKEFLKPGVLVHEGQRGSFRYYAKSQAGGEGVRK